MSKAKNTYNELDNKGYIVKKQAENRKRNHLFDILRKEGLNFYKINDFLIEYEVKNKKTKALILELVPEGDKHKPNIKRVQISKKMLLKSPGTPEEIIVIYRGAGANLFIKYNDIDSFSIGNLPDSSITTLFRLKIENLKWVFNKKELLKLKVQRRKSKIMVPIWISKKLSLILFKKNDKKKTEESERILEKKFNLEETHEKKELGRFGEKYVYDKLKNKNSCLKKDVESKLGIKITSVEWTNEEKELFKPYDLIINKEFFVEVKTSEKEGQFIYSVPENEKRKSDVKWYFLIKLNGVNLHEKKIENYKIYYKEDFDKFTFRVISWLVGEK